MSQTLFSAVKVKKIQTTKSYINRLKIHIQVHKINMKNFL